MNKYVFRVCLNETFETSEFETPAMVDFNEDTTLFEKYE